MSRHGLPGEPPDPYRGPDQYGNPPSDPWGAPVPGPYQPDPGYGGYAEPYPPPYEQPYPEPYHEPPYQQPPYREPYPEPYRDPYPPQPPPAPPPPRRNLGLYVTVVVLVVLAAAGVGYALYLLSGDEGDPGTPGTLATAGPSPAATGDPTASPGPAGSPPDNIGMNAAMARVEDCLVNDGSAEQPQMRIVPCDADEASQVFRVLAIVDERIEGEGEAANQQAQSACAETDGYTHHYYEVGDGASFVLCMAEEGADEG